MIGITLTCRSMLFEVKYIELELGVCVHLRKAMAIKNINNYCREHGEVQQTGSSIH